MDTQEFKGKLYLNGLDHHFETLAPLMRNSIRLYQAATDENDLKIGQTKIGGRPDLPKGVTWASEKSTIVTTQKKFLFFSSTKETKITKSLSFIAQINLSELAQLDSENLLPQSGFLYFFYSAEQEAAGFDPLDKDKFRVLYFDGKPDELIRADFPDDLPEYARYKPCDVVAKQEISLPSYGHKVYDDFDSEEDDIFWGKIYEDDNVNKLLGYSDNIQNEMELECELVTNGLFCGDATGYTDSKAKELEPNAKNWRLLLQIDSNEENEMMWGDCGRLYFWIKKDDLLNRKFDKSWFSFQCS